MKELMIFINTLPDTLVIGIIYSIMVMGVYITYKILDFPDMTVEGSFPMGSFIFAAFALSENGFFGITHPFMGLFLAVLGGMFAGFLTGYLHTKINIENLLAGILVGIGLYSINFRITGTSNSIIPAGRTIFDLVTYEKDFLILTAIIVVFLILKVFYDYKIKENHYVVRSISIYLVIFVILEFYVYRSRNIKLMLTTLIIFVIKMAIDYIMTSKFGFSLRALGNNEQLVVSLGVNEKKLKIYGLMISNGLVALSGALFTQVLKIADLQMGVGVIVVGLASIILGLGIMKKTKIINEISIIIIGTVIYYCIINFALLSNAWTKNLYKSLDFSVATIKMLEFKPTDLKVITSLVLAIILWIEFVKKKRRSKKFETKGGEKK